MISYIIFLIVLLISVAIYIYCFLKRAVSLLKGWKNTKKQKCFLGCVVAILTIPVINIFRLWAVVVLYILGAALVIDVIRMIIVRVSQKRNRILHVIYCSGIVPVIITALMLGYGYINMQKIVRTEYTVSTEKNIREGGYTIVFLSDLHYGTTMNSQELQEKCELMEQEKPDLVVLGGDIVDEASSLEEIQEAFRILGGINSTYGTYYVYGNHDKGRYSADCDFTEIELQETIEENGIYILEDETIQLNEELTVTGRRDRLYAGRSNEERELTADLLKNENNDGLHILVDHQPREMGENAEAGYDLMLSGHTHAGQVWSMGIFTALFDRNTVNYGQKEYGKMDIIVSSGIAGWGYPIRTGGHCEYVVVNLVH